MRISPVKFSNVNNIQPTKTNSTTAFQGKLVNNVADVFRLASANDGKSFKIEGDIKELKRISKDVLAQSKIEDRIKSVSLLAGDANDFKAYTVIDEENLEKLVFIDFDNPEKTTKKMFRYSFLEGMDLKKGYEFYNNGLKDYRLDVFDYKEPGDDLGFDMQYNFQKGKLVYYKNSLPAIKEGFEILYSKDGITYRNGIVDKKGSIKVPSTEIFLANDRKNSTYTEFDEQKDCYVTYQYDKQAKKWQQIKESDSI